LSPWLSFVLFISRYCCLPFAIGDSDVHMHVVVAILLFILHTLWIESLLTVMVNNSTNINQN